MEGRPELFRTPPHSFWIVTCLVAQYPLYPCLQTLYSDAFPTETFLQSEPNPSTPCVSSNLMQPHQPQIFERSSTKTKIVLLNTNSRCSITEWVTHQTLIEIYSQRSRPSRAALVAYSSRWPRRAPLARSLHPCWARIERRRCPSVDIA